MTVNILASILFLLGVLQIVCGLYLIRSQRIRSANNANFLYTLTHDSLSNPIQSASAAVENIERSILSDKRNDLLEINNTVSNLKIALRRLSRTAHNLRHLALLQVDDRSAVSEPVNLVSIAQHLILDMGQEAKKAGVKLVYEGNDQKITVLQQPEFVHNILKNITHNAIKYAACRSDGLVVLSISNAGAVATVVISDNGMGIPAEQLPTLTTSPQKPKAQTIENAGSGLGLYLVARLVEQCRGRLDIQSQPGNGTTVTVTLPRLNAAD